METTMNQENKELEYALLGGSSAEAIAGAATVVLAILGLAQIAPRFMISIGAIALGVALIANGAAVAAEYSRILARSGSGGWKGVELGGGVSTQLGAGVAAVVLGVLALLNVDPTGLVAIAAIVLGAALILSSGVSTRLNALKIEVSQEHDVAKRVARDAVTAATGTEVLVGLAATVLGILALVGIASTTLILVAVLSLGAAVLLTGGALIGKILSVFAA